MKLTWYGKFLYTQSKVKKLVSNSPGNYMISVKFKSGKYRSIYVGQATKLQNRLLDHFSSLEKNTCLKKNVKEFYLAFRFCYVSVQKDRNNVEYTLYKKYPHECNDKVPTGSIIPITPPY